MVTKHILCIKENYFKELINIYVGYKEVFIIVTDIDNNYIILRKKNLCKICFSNKEKMSFSLKKIKGLIFKVNIILFFYIKILH